MARMVGRKIFMHSAAMSAVIRVGATVPMPPVLRSPGRRPAPFVIHGRRHGFYGDAVGDRTARNLRALQKFFNYYLVPAVAEFCRP